MDAKTELELKGFVQYIPLEAGFIMPVFGFDDRLYVQYSLDNKTICDFQLLPDYYQNILIEVDSTLNRKCGENVLFGFKWNNDVKFKDFTRLTSYLEQDIAPQVKNAYLKKSISTFLEDYYYSKKLDKLAKIRKSALLLSYNKEFWRDCLLEIKKSLGEPFSIFLDNEAKLLRNINAYRELEDNEFVSFFYTHRYFSGSHIMTLRDKVKNIQVDENIFNIAVQILENNYSIDDNKFLIKFVKAILIDILSSHDVYEAFWEEIFLDLFKLNVYLSHDTKHIDKEDIERLKVYWTNKEKSKMWRKNESVVSRMIIAYSRYSMDLLRLSIKMSSLRTSKSKLKNVYGAETSRTKRDNYYHAQGKMDGTEGVYNLPWNLNNLSKQQERDNNMYDNGWKNSSEEDIDIFS